MNSIHTNTHIHTQNLFEMKLNSIELNWNKIREKDIKLNKKISILEKKEKKFHKISIKQKNIRNRNYNENIPN